jgi:hypothetical protein
MKTILFNSTQFPGEEYYDVQNSSTTAYKVVLNKLGMGSVADSFQRVEFDITDPNNPVEVSTADSSGPVNGIYTFPDGDTFNPTTREYTFASGTNRFLSATVDESTPPSGPIDNQIVDPVITSDATYVDDNNHVVYLSKLTRVVGESGINVTTDSTRPGEVKVAISGDFTPNLPDDLTGNTLSISGNSTLSDTSISSATIETGAISSATITTGAITTATITTATMDVAKGNYFSFRRTYTKEEAKALPKNTLVILTGGEVVVNV